MTLPGLLEHVGVHPLHHIGQHVAALAVRHVDRVGLVDVPGAKRPHVAALVAEAEGVERILQFQAVHPVDLSAGGEITWPASTLTSGSMVQLALTTLPRQIWAPAPTRLS